MVDTVAAEHSLAGYNFLVADGRSRVGYEADHSAVAQEPAERWHRFAAGAVAAGLNMAGAGVVNGVGVGDLADGALAVDSVRVAGNSAVEYGPAALDYAAARVAAQDAAVPVADAVDDADFDDCPVA